VQNQSLVEHLAGELGLTGADPAHAIISFCEARVASFIGEFDGCSTLSGLLEIAAQKSGSRFEVIDTNETLDRIVRKYVERSELAFATLEREFLRGVLGVTFRLQTPQPWELPFVSVIDGRGDRQRRSYFTKWHEVGHLLILTDDNRSCFRRTHVPGGDVNWEEALVDIIASRCGFHPLIVRPHIGGEISFQEIERLRRRLCPEASGQAARLGFTNAWPTPCLLLECQLGTRRSGEPSEPVLRAVHVQANEAAESSGLSIRKNNRVPRCSVISRVFGREHASAEAVEDIRWWETSDCSGLSPLPVLVRAASRASVVDALVVPVKT
jgi:hypothetical protein